MKSVSTSILSFGQKTYLVYISSLFLVFHKKTRGKKKKNEGCDFPFSFDKISKW